MKMKIHKGDRVQVMRGDEQDKDKIVGQPIGEQALREELRYAMIPYSAEELVAIAEKEFAWCEADAASIFPT